mmetsp:Transcript_15035/g.26641  ORF Transcript_15035/g.26641 Transcript_15035/m.26641 type:complete len:239 (-) Transcript_15035:120-836(-)
MSSKADRRETLDPSHRRGAGTASTAAGTEGTAETHAPLPRDGTAEDRPVHLGGRRRGGIVRLGKRMEGREWLLGGEGRVRKEKKTRANFVSERQMKAGNPSAAALDAPSLPRLILMVLNIVLSLWFHFSFLLFFFPFFLFRFFPFFPFRFFPLPFFRPNQRQGQAPVSPIHLRRRAFSLPLVPTLNPTLNPRLVSKLGEKIKKARLRMMSSPSSYSSLSSSSPMHPLLQSLRHRRKRK